MGCCASRGNARTYACLHLNAWVCEAALLRLLRKPDARFGMNGRGAIYAHAACVARCARLLWPSGGGRGRSALAAVANLHIGSHPYHHDRGHAPGQLQDPPIPSSFEHACVDAVWPCHAVRPYAYVGIVYGISISSCMRTSFSHSRLSIPALKMPE